MSVTITRRVTLGLWPIVYKVVINSYVLQESAVDFTEIEEALVLVKQKKQKLAAHPDFLQQVDEELEKGSMV